MKFTTATAAVALAAATTVSADTIAPTQGQHLCCAANQARQQNGLPDLKWVPSMDTIATAHSQYMMTTDDVTHFEGTNENAVNYALGGRLTTINLAYSTAGENIASGFSSVPSVQAAWMNSPGHKANILGPGFDVCGGGVAFSDPTTGYYTVDFAGLLETADINNYYTLSCSNGLSQGATSSSSSSTPDAHAAQSASTAAAAASPVVATTTTTAAAAAAQQPAQAASTTAAAVAAASPTSSTSSSGSPGKCMRMPKGSIAAGKCKACTKCASSNRRRR
ncbi:hypothetical protein EV175_005835 [Coemansia sp. RSA 1933]|nr:hypothetical protein EV175_005835 [Coemansia sp. RSA 1933]